MSIIGVRHDLPNYEFDEMKPGEYGCTPDGDWVCYVPAAGFAVGTLGRNHVVTEHEDQTITVSPSIVCYGDNGQVWHGWLEHGIWREV